MLKDWKLYKLGDVAKLNYGKALIAGNRNEGDVPVYSSAGITGWHNEALVNSEGIVIGRKGTVGSVFYSEQPFFCIDTAYYIKPDDDSYDLEFLYYKLLSMNLPKFSGDSAVPGLNREIAYAQEILLPEIEEQRRIAEILFALDEKIKLNLEMNRTLERIAQATFKHWFVDFQFPGFDGELVGSLPKGWSETELGNVVDLIIDHRGKTPLKMGDDWKDEGITAISAKNVKNGTLINLNNVGYISEGLYERWMKDKLKPFDILLTSEAPLGEMAMLISNTKYCLSQRLYALRTNEKCNSIYFYYYLLSPQGQSNIQKRATGSTVFGIRQSELRKVEIVLPPMKIQNLFGDVVGSLKVKIDENENQIKVLTQIRDNLLPKLMNGKIRVTK